MRKPAPQRNRPGSFSCAPKAVRASPNFAKGADILVHEVIDLKAIEQSLGTRLAQEKLGPLVNHMRTEHSTAQQVGETASEAGVKQVVLSHLVQGQATNDAAYIADVRKFYSGPAVVGRDLMEF